MAVSNLWSTLLDPYLIGVGLVLLSSSIAILVLSRRESATDLRQLILQRRRTSGSKTPPRSLSPSGEKDTAEQKAETRKENRELFHNFPPSRHHVLEKLPESKVPIGPEPSVEMLREQAMSTKKTMTSASTGYTATGFSAAEIKALGDFPRYDLLSGVPLPEPYEEFDPSNALPRPYRPFRWGYHQTMCECSPFVLEIMANQHTIALTKMEPNWWLEVDKDYVHRVNERIELYKQYGSKVLDCQPGGELACKELMEMCLQFYCARYPKHFSLSADKRIFHNKLTGKDTDLNATPPLHVLLHNVPEDFAIVLRNEADGLYYFRAGCICSSLGWNVSTKIGMTLKDIHKPIPDYKEKMSFSMDRFFSKMPTDAPIQRGSWGLEIGKPLFMPPGHPHEKLREVQKPDLTIEECNLRVDWQTLRRLPLSGAIVFNFKGLFTPVTEFRDEPYIPALLLKLLREGKKSLMEYKATWHVEHVCIPAFEKYDEEQRKKGWIKPEQAHEAEWDVCTLKESPYFPNWEKKWHAQQGF
jgi:hypothetical protein